MARTIAATQGDSKNAHRQHRLAAIGLRNDGVIVGASNLCCRHKCPEAHAEYRVTKMLTANSTVFVVRVNRNGQLAMAKPCHGCQSYMKNNGVRRCYYSINDTEYGVIIL
jgi:cytidine deaminase